MGIEALTHRDDGSEVGVPVSPAHWRGWVSAGRTRNHMLGDPLLDWLQLYGKDRDYIPRKELADYQKNSISWSLFSKREGNSRLAYSVCSKRRFR